jgi:DNA-binding NtrC family response regulator
MSSRVLLCEQNPLLARILIQLFASERIGVRECDSLQDIERALIEYPHAVVIADSWTDFRHGDLTVCERDAIKRLGQRTAVVMTTGRSWAYKASELDLGPRVSVIPKPYDLEQLLEAVRAGIEPTPA